MFFRNLTLFRFPTDVAERVQHDLDSSLREAWLRDIGPLEFAVRGFVSPLGRQSDVPTHTVGDFTLVTLGGHDKIMPASVVNEELAHRLEKITEEEGRRVGARERKRLKDEVLTDLLTRAFTRPTRMSAYFDWKQLWFVVDTSSRRAAEELLTAVREAVGSFPAVPMAPQESVRGLMTDWVVHGNLPDGFALGDEVELRDPAEDGSVVRCRRQDLETDEVREHLKSGKQVFQLSLTFDDRLSFVLGEDLVVRKLRFLDQVLDELGEEKGDGPNHELDSRFALMTLELRALLARLDDIFGLSGNTLALDPGPTPKSMREAERGKPALDESPAFASAAGKLARSLLKSGTTMTISVPGSDTPSVTITPGDAKNIIKNTERIERTARAGKGRRKPP